MDWIYPVAVVNPDTSEDTSRPQQLRPADHALLVWHLRYEWDRWQQHISKLCYANEIPDSEIIDLWLHSQSSPATMHCCRRDAERLLDIVRKPLSRIGVRRPA